MAQWYIWSKLEEWWNGDYHKRKIEENITAEFEKATVFPDIRLDQALLKAFGHQSLKVLRRHYEQKQKELALPIDSWIKDLVAKFGSQTPIPFAAGLGALVIGMLIDTIVAEHNRRASDEETYEKVFERVFAREKASKVRDIMEEYVKRHKMHIRHPEELKKELARLEKDLSLNLTQLKNSMKERHMSSQALKMWINGACFHIQMRLHLARLGEGDSTPARALISVYKTDWEMLLTEYKSFKLKSVTYTIEKKTTVTYHLRGSRTSWSEFVYEVTDDESQQTFETIGALKLKLDIDPVDKYVDVLMASCQINEVHDHFTELREHLDELINQQDAFDVTPLP